jgi:osomolarity two-component system response regulator SSK1
MVSNSRRSASPLSVALLRFIRALIMIEARIPRCAPSSLNNLPSKHTANSISPRNLHHQHHIEHRTLRRNSTCRPRHSTNIDKKAGMTTPAHHGSSFAPAPGVSRHSQSSHSSTASSKSHSGFQSSSSMQASQAKGLPPTPTTTTPPTSFPTVNGNRRVWVCRPGATPTTVLVPAELIVDDLKSVVLAKFPTSLQRTTDPADLAIRLPQSAQPPPSRLSNSHLAPPASPALAAAAAATEEYRSATSPHLTSFTQALRKKQPAKPSPLTIKTPSQSASTAAVPQPHPLGDPLSPDINVWQLLDTHFPHGMRMDDALIIDGETVEAAQPVHAPLHHHAASPHPHHQPSHIVKQVITPHAIPQQPHLQTPGQDAFPGPPSATDEETIYDEDTKPARKRRDIGSAGSSQHSVAGAAGASSGSPSQSPAAAGTAQGGVLLLPRQFRGGTRNSDKEPSAARKKGSSPAPDDKRRQAPPQPQHQQQSQQQPPQQPAAQPPQPKPVPQQAVAASQAHQSKQPAQQAASDPPPKPTISITARPNGATITESPSNTNLHMLGKQKKEEPTVPAPPTPATATAATVAGPTGKTLRKEDTKVPAPQKTPQPGVQAQAKPELRRTRTPLSAKVQKGPTTMETIVPRVNVLIVEDNEINQKILEAFMRKRKIRSSVAKNGREALEKWRQGGYHLILMDIQLPVMSGILVTKEIRRLEHQNKIGVFSGGAGAGQSTMAPVDPEDVLDSNLFRSPVIIVALTASSLKEDKSEALAAGCNDFLTKPVNMVWLERKIMEWGCMQALIDFEGWKMWRGRDFDGAHAPAIGRALANTHLTQPVSATRSRSRSNSRLVRQNSTGTGSRSKLSMTPVASPSTAAPPSSSVSAPPAVTAATHSPAVPSKNGERPPVSNKPAPEQYRLDPPKVEVPAK